MNCPPCSGLCNQGRDCPDRPITTPEECEFGAYIAVAVLLILSVAIAVFGGPSLVALALYAVNSLFI